jgi:hypothetical protein
MCLNKCEIFREFPVKKNMFFFAKIRINKIFTNFKFFKAVHHHTIQINQKLDATISSFYYPEVYLQLNIFRASSHPSSGAQQLL